MIKDHAPYHRIGLGISPSRTPLEVSFTRAAAQELEALPRQATSLPGTEEILKRQAQLRTTGKTSDVPSMARDIYHKEATYRFQQALEAPVGFAERLVWFWSDHFTVGVKNPLVRALAGAFEREAIRARMHRSFSDMLLSASLHPAMLLYLDNVMSTGPYSIAGQRRDRGLNENLAREILELHTMGAGQGYAQNDVKALAKVLTGWTVNPKDPPKDGRASFRPAMHEPGAHTVAGLTAPADAPSGQAAMVLRHLATRPETARHIATKLARHFISPQPDPKVVAALTNVFLKTGGDLPTLHKYVLVFAQRYAPQKPFVGNFRSPNEYVVAALRAAAPTMVFPARRVLGILNELGQAPWSANSPAGWPDTAQSWNGSGALQARLGFALQMANRIDQDARQLVKQLLPAASTATQLAIHKAESPQQGMALLLMSPEFQRK